MNDVDCVIKRDVYLQKIQLVSKNNCGISFSVKKISVVHQRKIYHGCYCMDILLVALR